MSEDSTKEMDGAKPILERILARLDSMDERQRVLEEQSERRAMETKPMWERALAEISETRQEMKEGFADVIRRVSIMNDELLAVKADQRRIDKQVDDLERRPS